MTRFWLGTCELGLPVASAQPEAEPLLAAGSRALAIEVIHDEASGELAVLFATVDDVANPHVLECAIGFANGAKACSIWRDRGFPLVDAEIGYENGTVSVVSPFFGASDAMRYEDRLLRIDGVVFADDPKSTVALSSVYRQYELAPDDVMPATFIERREVVWIPGRAQIRTGASVTVTLSVPGSRTPSLAPFASGNLVLANLWTGFLALPAAGVFPGVATQRLRRRDTFGLPAFRFEDVEVLGFRVDLDRLGIDGAKGLAELVAPLNFHLRETPAGGARADYYVPTDFRYRAATTTLIIELLRYGRMKLSTPHPPLGADDFQSQHELVVRILVGRVEDDTAQAHSPAIWVPAVFVDNPWSKVVGRDLQGFDKRLANFCVYASDTGLLRLRPDGRVAASPQKAHVTPAAGELVPLASIAQVNLAQRAGTTAGPVLVELDCPPERYPNFHDFEKIDLDLAMGSTSLAALRWQQGDFGAAEFRRSFARAAAFRTLKGFRSIQVSPVGQRGLERAWITGTFVVDDDMRIVRPAGVAGITLHAKGSAPKGWRQLCRLLGADDKSDTPLTISFPTGTWYRLKCAMNLTIDDGLEW